MSNENNKKDLIDYYERQIDLTSHPGWLEFMETVDNIIEQSSNLNAINSADKLFFNKGQLDILNWLRNWDKLVKAGLDQINSDADL